MNFGPANLGTAFPLPAVASWLSQAMLDFQHRTVLLLGQAPEAAPAQVEGAPNAAPGSLLEFLASPINLILISAILFMFMVARPKQKQRKEQEEALLGLKKNDRVVTNSGVHGIVVQVNPDEATVTMRIDENSGARMTVNRDTIANITPSDSKE